MYFSDNMSSCVVLPSVTVSFLILYSCICILTSSVFTLSLHFVQINPDAVCGCPINTDLFAEGEVLCRAPKKKCVKHFCWEKLRRAEIDMHRLRQVVDYSCLFA